MTTTLPRLRRATALAAAGLLTVLAVPGTPASADGIDVASLRNHDGICETPGDACNFDDGGFGYSSLALTAGGTSAGQEVDVDGFTYTWPDAPSGAPDNITLVNQVVPVAQGDATRIGLLGASHNGPVTADVTLHYVDAAGDALEVVRQIRVSDWTLNGGSADPVPGNTIAVSSPFRVLQGLAPLPDESHAFSLAIDLDPALELTAIEFPREKRIHLFDITLA